MSNVAGVLPTYLLTYLLYFTLPHLLACLLTCLLADLLACLLTCLLTHSLTQLYFTLLYLTLLYLLTYFLTFLLSYFRRSDKTIWLRSEVQTILAHGTQTERWIEQLSMRRRSCLCRTRTEIWWVAELCFQPLNMGFAKKKKTVWDVAG